MEPYSANLVYGTGPTTPTLCTWNLFLSTQWANAWKKAATEAAWLSAVPWINQQPGLTLPFAVFVTSVVNRAPEQPPGGDAVTSQLRCFRQSLFNSWV